MVNQSEDSAAAMAFFYYLVISVHVITCLLLIAIVLLQQGKGQDLASAFGGGGSQTAFGPRGSATVLSRATTILAALFMITSLSLSVMKSGRSSVLDQVQDVAAPAPVATAGPAETPAGAAESSPAAEEPAATPAPE
jgi:preprotein translocase subunit SecG